MLICGIIIIIIKKRTGQMDLGRHARIDRATGEARCWLRGFY